MNYWLIRMMYKQTGLVIGHNKYGSQWVELWWRGSVVTLHIIDNDPKKKANKQGEVTVVRER